MKALVWPYLVLCLTLCVSAAAQTGRPQRGVAPSENNGGRRLALVIGNDAYPENALHNAVNDARAMKSALEDSGFAVQIKLNATQQQMETSIDEFTGKVNPGDVALFFYAGRGIQINDQNYLVPIDFKARRAADVKYSAYPAQKVLDDIEAAGRYDRLHDWAFEYAWMLNQDGLWKQSGAALARRQVVSYIVEESPDK